MFLSSIFHTILLSCACVNGINVEGVRSNSSTDCERTPSIKQLGNHDVNIEDYVIYSISRLEYPVQVLDSDYSIRVQSKDILFYFVDADDNYVSYWDYIPFDSCDFEYRHGSNGIGMYLNDDYQSEWFHYDFGTPEDSPLAYDFWGTGGLDYTLTDSITTGYFALKRGIDLSFFPCFKTKFYDFTFNSQINRFGLLVSNDTNSLSPVILGTYGLRQFFKGLFYDDNGILYSGMNIVYVDGYVSNYVDYSEGNPKYVFIEDNPDVPHCTLYMYIEFIRINGTTKLVNKQDNIQHDGHTYVSNTSSWVSDFFRHINIINVDYVSSNLPTNHLSGLDRLNTFNKGYVTGGFVGGTGGIGNVTNIVYTGLSGLAGLFGLMILPGISLGLLIFLPLIFSLLLFILKLFKR